MTAPAKHAAVKAVATRAAVVSTISTLLGLLVALGILPATTNVSTEAQVIAAGLLALFTIGNGIAHYFATRHVVKAAASSTTTVVNVASAELENSLPAESTNVVERVAPGEPDEAGANSAAAAVEAALVEAQAIHPADMSAPVAEPSTSTTEAATTAPARGATT